MWGKKTALLKKRNLRKMKRRTMLIRRFDGKKNCEHVWQR
jgi:hypothetical protein